jgi:ectoine hydroxylase-related dioxygenase (phytanoyl-CoA dioxygenase family)
MNIDRQQFAEDGFLILRNVVPPDQLDGIRAGVEHMVDGRREREAQRRLPGEPEGGAWVAAGQPRLAFDRDCDASSANVIEFLLGETTLGVCRQLIDAEQVGPHFMACICSSESHDTGPATWHRDIGPGDPAPLEGMIANMTYHGPSYLQWNIALYEDRVFWIVPQSHRRVNTAAEIKHLKDKPRTPLPGGIPVKLGPGDGVVYTHLLLHWGSNYTCKLRRTLHPGYRPFGFASMPNVHWRHWEPGFFHYLTPKERKFFETLDRLFLDEIELFASLFRAAIESKPEAFSEGLSRLHPSPQAQAVTLAMLTRLSVKFCHAKGQDTPQSGAWFNDRDFDYLDRLFSKDEAQVLAQRFAPLEDGLQLPEPAQDPSFQQFHLSYEPNKMPEGFSVEGFFKTWNK